MNTQQAKRIMEKAFSERRRLKILSHAHDEGHVCNVAGYGSQIAEGIAKKNLFYEDEVMHIRMATEIAGYLHDIVRLPKETEPHAIESAKWVAYAAGYSDKFNEAWAVLPSERLELDQKWLTVVQYAIRMHEDSIGQVIRESGFEQRPPDEKAIAAVSLKIGDALLEASGFRVVERRCFFVGNERLNNGDLKFLKEHESTRDLPYVWAVLGETIVRLYGRNTILDYPKWVQGVAAELQAVQYRFYRNLLKIVGEDLRTDELKIAEFLAGVGFPRMDAKLLEVIRTQRHLTSEFLSQYPPILDEIAKGKDDDAGALLHIMRAISESATDSKSAYDIWKMGVNTSHFARGIIEYNEGSIDYASRIVDAYNY